MRVAIIITGKLEGYIDNIINQYTNIINNENICKIISTCDNIDKLTHDILVLNGFIVIENKFPENINTNSYNYQHCTYHEGIKIAKKLNYTHVLRIRTDILISDLSMFLDTYKNIYVSKPIFLSYFHHECGYLVDYIYFFNINYYDNIVINYQNLNDNRFPEKYLCETHFGTCNWDILKNMISLSLKELLLKNIKIEWIKPDRKGSIENGWDYNLFVIS